MLKSCWSLSLELFRGKQPSFIWGLGYLCKGVAVLRSLLDFNMRSAILYTIHLSKQFIPSTFHLQP